LCGLFADVLGLDHVTIDDNFFTLGGDSIMSIQLAGRARRAGFAVSPRDVFEYPDVVSLAAAAADLDDERAEPPGAGVGEVLPTPVIRWFAELGGPVDRFNQSRLLHAPAGADLATLTATLQALLDHHDALRLRVEISPPATADAPDPECRLSVPEPGSVRAADCLRRIDATGVDASGYDELVRSEAVAARERLELAAGRVVQAVWFDRGPDEAGRFYLIVHHVAVDAVSWRILLPDLAEAWAAVSGGTPVRLQPTGTSFRTWSRRLTEWSRHNQRRAELDHWTTTLAGQVHRIGARPLDPSRDVVATARTITQRLPVDTTEAVLSSVPQMFHAELTDVLLTGLAVAFAVRGHADADGLLVDLEGHGREEETIGGVDLSRTVGWFTSLYPVRLDPGDATPDDGSSLGNALKRVKEQLRAVPDRGLGYGVLRYLDPRGGERLRAARQPQIGFNYLGRITVADPDGSPGDWSPVSGVPGSSGQDPAMRLPHTLEIAVVTRDGSAGPQLETTWVWPRDLLPEADVRDIVAAWFEALAALAGHAQRAGGGFTPSDVALTGLSQDEIDLLEAEWRTDE
ncbi:condensation domain-containing protein, partial [Micromonospora echinospora]|uniref:condensation domain-containing protein n=1 Tax=Micromonospora echinospora TaxID=1877 RepID=UPI003CF134E4